MASLNRKKDTNGSAVAGTIGVREGAAIFQFEGSTIPPSEVSQVISYQWARPTRADVERILAGLNQHNRSLSEKSVTAYASDLVSGAWFDGGAFPILFGPTGELLDGQHRLTALRRVMTADPFFATWVRVGYVATEDAARRIRMIANRGRPDTTGSIAEKEDLVERGKGNTIAAIVNVILMHEIGDQIPVSPARFRVLYERERAGIDFVVRETSGKRFNAAVRAGLVYCFPFGVEVAELVRVVQAGAGFEADSVADLFCRSVDVDRGGVLRRGKGAGAQMDQFRMTLRLVKAHMTGERLLKLQRSTEGVDWARRQRESLGIPVATRLDAERKPLADVGGGAGP